MEIIDTHCHLYLSEFDADREEMLVRAQNIGVTRFYLPNIDAKSLPLMMDMVLKHPDGCLPMLGLHPCSVKDDWQKELSDLEKNLSQYEFAAIGEIGLDYYWDKTFITQQQEAFERQMQWARDHMLPIVIHSRNSMQECINQVKPHAKEGLRGIFHCFSGSYELARQILDMGFYLGIGGVVTYKNAGLPAVLARIGLDYLVLETDAPYLTPVPFRGKRNEPAYLEYVVEQIAQALSVSGEEVARATTANAMKIFQKG